MRQNGKESSTMGGFPREKQVLLQWKDNDGPPNGYILPHMHPDHRDQWPIFWVRVSDTFDR